MDMSEVGELKDLSLYPSEFTEFAFYMPVTGGGYAPFSFEGRRHMYRCYDTPAKRILLFCGRQVEKSTLLGNRALCYMCLRPASRILYVSPSATQTVTFSNDRIKEPIETSPVLRKFTTRMLSQTILAKQFLNRSIITMRYAFLNADRARGIPATTLLLDEFQDILSDNIPVIEQCLSHADKDVKVQIYAGTPKSLDNNLEVYRAKYSTQGEWVVPCDSCGNEGSFRYWNVLGEKNIARKGLSCERCGKLINPMHPDAQWARMVEHAPFESYRIPQLMVPWVAWDEIMLNYERYPRAQFYNEVLGISYDSGLRPLTIGQLQEVCNEDVLMVDAEEYIGLGASQPIFMGIDWGTGEGTYTVVTLGTYVDMKFRIFYARRFTGAATSPSVQMEIIYQLIDRYNVRLVGVDYGGGFDRNDLLMRRYGPSRIFKYQYAARSRRKLLWNGELNRYIAHRTEVMSDIFNAIKKGLCELPCWEDWKDPFGQDMLNIFSEYNKVIRMIVYKNHKGSPDDTFHSILYCWLASMLLIKRPDIIVPRKEEDVKMNNDMEHEFEIY